MQARELVSRCTFEATEIKLRVSTPWVQNLELVQKVFPEGPWVAGAVPDVLSWEKGHSIDEQLSRALHH